METHAGEFRLELAIGDLAMNNDDIQYFITSLVEDFTLESLSDKEATKRFMRETMGLGSDVIEPILNAAIEIKTLRGNRLELWQEVIRQRYIDH